MNYHEELVNKVVGFTQSIFTVVGFAVHTIVTVMVIVDVVCLLCRKTPITSIAKDVASQKDKTIPEKISYYGLYMTLPLAGITLVTYLMVSGGIFTLTQILVEGVDVLVNNPSKLVELLPENLLIKVSLVVIATSQVLSLRRNKRSHF